MIVLIASPIAIIDDFYSLFISSLQSLLFRFSGTNHNIYYSLVCTCAFEKQPWHKNSIDHRTSDEIPFYRVANLNLWIYANGISNKNSINGIYRVFSGSHSSTVHLQRCTFLNIPTQSGIVFQTHDHYYYEHEIFVFDFLQAPEVDCMKLQIWASAYQWLTDILFIFRFPFLQITETKK